MSSDGPRYPEYPEYPEQPGTPQHPPSPTPPPSAGQTPPPPEQPPTSRPTNSKAIWAMVLGILGMVLCCFFAGVPAMVLGNNARKEIDASGGVQEGRGMAVAGLILGIISTVGSVLYVIGAAVYFGTDGFGQGLE